MGQYDLRGLSATVIGVAREGIALTRFLLEAGASVTLSDMKTAQQLGDALDDLQGLPVRLALGGHPAELLEADVLFLSPGVPLSSAFVRQAQARSIPIGSEPRLFAQLFAHPIVGITGSSGKTTTTTIIGLMLEAAGLRTWVGGNIGRPLIGALGDGPLADWAVMELSSFQLELMRPETQGPLTEEKRTAASRAISLEGWSPTIAVVTNITPNHLDRHSSMENYIWAKGAIVDYQKPSDWAVANADDALAYELATAGPGQHVQFSLQGPVDQGAFLAGDRLHLRLGDVEQVVCSSDEVQLRGTHNLANALAACCAAGLAGVSVAAMREVLTTFRGVPHRLEVVRTWHGITFINDSIATAPERAVAALRSIQEPIILLAGGRDKHLPWDVWADWVARRVRCVVAFGECAPLIREALQHLGERAPRLVEAMDLADAVENAVTQAQPGDVVLLSPGGTSFDAYRDFEARGQHFRRLVGDLQG
ncbi:MAG: UDP-N-acetylmuramoyl-L-alanine--D-glutamate ligase [Anaerolineae bacterium]|jgi:UDP-N-acetylmuramoylalanine--D-glutamate ligase|nr:UDP-N-acetylmuramoyl-L-alanine--D-glutamate ligase [Chloroflexota bacterium]